jgi:hypothetical protein
MDAGRELDALVAERCFGWRWRQYPAPGNKKMLTGLFPPEAPKRVCVPNHYDSIWLPSDATAPRFSDWDSCPWWEDGAIQHGIPSYSTDLAAAGQVLKKLDHDYFDINIQNAPGLTNEWYVQFTGLEHSVNAKTLPLAICLAALKALDACGMIDAQGANE